VGRGIGEVEAGESVTSPETVVGLPKHRVKLDEGFSKSLARCQEFLVRHLAKKGENAENGAIFGRLTRKSFAVFGRRKESFHHFGIVKVAVEVIQLVEPELVTAEVAVATGVRITAEISEVLH